MPSVAALLLQLAGRDGLPWVVRAHVELRLCIFAQQVERVLLTTHGATCGMDLSRVIYVFQLLLLQ